MPMALILSSHVAASMVGGSLQQRVFNSAGIDTMLVPTVTYGRHPGWGEPGGGVVEQDVFEGMLSGVVQQGMLNLTDVMLTGYFADVGHVFAAADTIRAVRAAPRTINGLRAFADQPLIAVDPVMGDSPEGLYVDRPIAAAIKDKLVTQADLITPNLFELGHMTGRPLSDLASMIRAARSLECPALISSLPRQGKIGVMFIDGEEAWMVTHDRCPKSPNGTGDLLTACFLTEIVNGASPKDALEHSTAATFSVIQRANEWNSPELPVIAANDVLSKPLIQLEAEAL
ncbi:MAG: PfkB family carbohydrate kinase [Maricaulis sp.]|jgi:pyridoxine kinase|nr:PfkB family carbohydrate kinase [Maricaulis sp.]MDG2043093.1 PfkB family carbohydrate kinase [Maricaulis sp.]